MAVHLSPAEAFRLRKSEWLCAILMTGYGVMSLLYPQMFEASPTLSALLGLAPQWAWGWTMTVIGALGVYALARNGWWRPSPEVRTFCAIARGIIWMQLFLALAGIGVAGWGVFAFPTYMAFEGINAWTAFRDIKKRPAVTQ